MNKQFKFSGSYTIPKVGVAASAVVQSTAGLMRNITYVVTRAQVPSLTLSSVTLPVNEPGTSYLPRINLLDLKFSKTFTVKTTRIQPNVAIFNVTNSAAIIQLNNRYGAALDQVQQIVDGRFIRFGVQGRLLAFGLADDGRGAPSVIRSRAGPPSLTLASQASTDVQTVTAPAHTCDDTLRELGLG